MEGWMGGRTERKGPGRFPTRGGGGGKVGLGLGERGTRVWADLRIAQVATESYTRRPLAAPTKRTGAWS